MSLAAATSYIQGLLDGMQWPVAMQALPSPPPPLAAYVMPPDPNVQGATPTAYVWFERGTESRDHERYGAGTVPRAQYQGGPSGTKAQDHEIPVYFVWNGGTLTDPNASTLFPGMCDAIMRLLRSSTDPAPVTDPWTGDESQLVDVGERMRWETDLRTLEPQQLPRMDALIVLAVTEIFAA